MVLEIDWPFWGRGDTQRNLRVRYSHMALHKRLLSGIFALLLLSGCAPDLGLKPLTAKAGVRSPEFRQSVGNLLGARFNEGNSITTLQNGDEIFPAMLGAIRSARRSVTFETYVFERGTVAQSFVDALIERARAGVQVLVAIDAHGGSKSKRFDAALIEAGVKVVRHNPGWSPYLLRFNNRTHRKLLVIDGKVGFIGGVGISDLWRGNAQSPEHWRDNHYRIEGPVVADIQAAFAANWLRAQKQILHGPDFFPPLRPTGNITASAFYSSPQRGSYGVPILYHMVFGSAKKSILIQNAYFAPDQDVVDAMTAAARRGVRVRVIVPGPQIDQKMVRRASQKHWKALLESGVEFYEYQPTMLHSKLLVVDGFFTSIGSANFDNRSLHLNDESNLNVLHAGFAAQQTAVFEHDLTRAKRITEIHEPSIFDRALGLMQTPVEGQF